jgi:glycosyltransferase involved in cell wall biosynthesis
MSKTEVSVILPVYNGSAYLSESIKSVLNQSHANFELIIVDDGSTDESPEIIKKYADEDKRIKNIRNKKNLGIQKSLNKGIKLSKGTYIARIDDDDLWCDKNKLEKQVEFLNNNLECGVIGTAMILIDSEGKELGKIVYKESDNDIRNNLLLASQLAHPSVVIRKKALDELGFYREDKKYRHTEDYELWLRLGTKYKLANLADYCIKYRINPKGLSLKNEFRQRLAGLGVTLEYRKKYPGAIKAIVMKIITLPVSRSLLDSSIQNNKLTRKVYSGLTGIDKG